MLAPFFRSSSTSLIPIMTITTLLLSISVVKSDLAADFCTGAAKPASCPVKCFTTDPVCGVDGVTYWCGCREARCNGVKVAKVGFCEVGNNEGTVSLSAQALLLVHIVWLIIIGIFVLFGLSDKFLMINSFKQGTKCTCCLL